MRTLALLALLLPALATATERIAVVVGLCDNATQGIAPVGRKIGDGDKPDDNLYWGCSDGLRAFFQKSANWKLERRETETGDARILERLHFRHTRRDAVLVAEAWRGSKLGDALVAFERAAVSGGPDLVAFIGHNPLMDHDIAPPARKAGKPVDAIVLCCLSQRFFGERLGKLGVRPVLTTDQLMYPGSFLLHDALEKWLVDAGRPALREAAAAAYARNQKISVKAARGVFAELE
jgi:hypothetical protein